MAEPTSTTTLAVVAAGVGLTALLPGIDGDAVVGAFAGGTLFVVSAAAMPLWQRAVYLLLSTVAGYYATPDLLARLPLQSSGLVAFLSSSVIITVTLGAIEAFKKFDYRRALAAWARRGGPPRA